MDAVMIVLLGFASFSGILGQTDEDEDEDEVRRDSPRSCSLDPACVAFPLRSAGVHLLLPCVYMACKSFIFSKNFSFPAELTYEGRGDKLSKFTVCLTSCTNMTESVMFSVLSALHYDYFYVILGGGSDANTGLIWIEGRRVDINFPNDDIRPRRSICLSWDSSSAKLVLWVNGEIRENKEFEKRGIQYLDPRIFIGPGQIFLGGKPMLDVGEVTDVHVWDRVLKPREVKDYYKKKGKVGNVINWRALKYDRAEGDFIIGPFQCKS
ncbi:C-reactive protein-like [Engystomops pustulosus]|uniref:C-reactive protein-like n=1 Tax=Engystomops pustulosus TaxID=76066 RepID=UPI003AFB7E6B